MKIKKLKIDRRKHLLLNKKSERPILNILAFIFFFLFAYWLALGLVSASPVDKKVGLTGSFITSTSTSSKITTIPVEAPVIIPQETKSTTSSQESKPEVKQSPCNIDSLLQGKFKGQKDLLLKTFSCDKARRLLALAGTETSFCTAGVGKQNNCFAIKGNSGKFLSFKNIEEAITQANKWIGKYLNMSNAELLNNKAYCASGCTNWKNNMQHFLSI